MANVYKAPGTIYLQLDPTWTPESNYPQFEGVTWSVECINDSDVLYVRAPALATLRETLPPSDDD